MAAFAAPARASFLVYVCGPNLCRINPDGSGQKQLTTDGQQGTSSVYGGPSLSRDGSKLAFAFDYHVIVADGSAAHRGTPFATTALLALMRPDGGAVAELEDTFSSPPVQLCTYTPTGGSRNCPYGTPSAGWAPDGNLLISVGTDAPPYSREIQLCSFSGSGGSPCGAVKAYDPSNDLYDPAVSPDGATLAVTVAQGVGGPVTGHIALYNYATGAFERNLTSGTGDDLPAWSPDGSQIAFDRGNSIYTIAFNGAAGSEHRLVASGSQPTWGGPATVPPPPRLRLTLSAAGRQHVLAQRALRATVTCSLACTAHVSAAVTIAGVRGKLQAGPVVRRVGAGAHVEVTLSLSRHARSVIAAALARHKRVRAQITATAGTRRQVLGGIVVVR